MKKILSAALALAMVLSLLPAAFAAGGTAYASTQAVEVDGKKVEFQMYALKDANGNPTNYVKLRDVAHVLNGTRAQFAVGYDGTISVTTGTAYTDVGGEMTTPYSGDRTYRDGSGAVKVNGQAASLESIILTDDAGGDYTYFKLRDLGTALGFKVDWSADRGVFLETGTQSPGSSTTLPANLEGVWRSVEGSTINEFWLHGNEFTFWSTTGIGLDVSLSTGTITGVETNYQYTRPNGEVTIFPIVIFWSGTTQSVSRDGTYENLDVKDAIQTFAEINTTNEGYTYFISDKILPFPPQYWLSPSPSPYYETALAKLAEGQGIYTEDGPFSNYVYRAAKQLYSDLKFPNSLEILNVKCGCYDRLDASKKDTYFSKTDSYYVVTITYRGANSFGAMTTDIYVTLFDMTTDSATYNLVGFADRILEYAWGPSKINALDLKNEALALALGGELPARLTSAQVQELQAKVKS